MRVTPRKDEVAAIAQLLESPDYDSADALARDVIKRVAELFAEREWYALAWRLGPGSPVLSWGPLSSDSEAEKFGSKLSVGGEGISVKLHSTAAMLQRFEDSDIAPSTLCGNCKHPHGTHRHEKRLGKCQVRGCKCTTDIK